MALREVWTLQSKNDVKRTGILRIYTGNKSLPQKQGSATHNTEPEELLLASRTPPTADSGLSAGDAPLIIVALGRTNSRAGVCPLYWHAWRKHPSYIAKPAATICARFWPEEGQSLA